MNQVIIVGNLGTDPEIKRLDGGVTVGNITVAVTEKFKKKSGEVEESTEWFRVVVWNRLAEFVEKHSKKGTKIMVIGKVKFRSYEKDGQKQYITEIHAERVEQLTWPKDSEISRPINTGPEPGDDLPF